MEETIREKITDSTSNNQDSIVYSTTETGWLTEERETVWGSVNMDETSQVKMGRETMCGSIQANHLMQKEEVPPEGVVDMISNNIQQRDYAAEINEVGENTNAQIRPNTNSELKMMIDSSLNVTTDSVVVFDQEIMESDNNATTHSEISINTIPTSDSVTEMPDSVKDFSICSNTVDREKKVTTEEVIDQINNWLIKYKAYFSQKKCMGQTEYDDMDKEIQMMVDQMYSGECTAEELKYLEKMVWKKICIIENHMLKNVTDSVYAEDVDNPSDLSVHSNIDSDEENDDDYRMLPLVHDSVQHFSFKDKTFLRLAQSLSQKSTVMILQGLTPMKEIIEDDFSVNFINAKDFFTGQEQRMLSLNVQHFNEIWKGKEVVRSSLLLLQSEGNVKTKVSLDKKTTLVVSSNSKKYPICLKQEGNEKRKYYLSLEEWDSFLHYAFMIPEMIKKVKEDLFKE